MTLHWSIKDINKIKSIGDHSYIYLVSTKKGVSEHLNMQICYQVSTTSKNGNNIYAGPREFTLTIKNNSQKRGLKYSIYKFFQVFKMRNKWEC